MYLIYTTENIVRYKVKPCTYRYLSFNPWHGYITHAYTQIAQERVAKTTLVKSPWKSYYSFSPLKTMFFFLTYKSTLLYYNYVTVRLRTKRGNVHSKESLSFHHNTNCYNHSITKLALHWFSEKSSRQLYVQLNAQIIRISIFPNSRVPCAVLPVAR